MYSLRLLLLGSLKLYCIIYIYVYFFVLEMLAGQNHESGSRHAQMAWQPCAESL